MLDRVSPSSKVPVRSSRSVQFPNCRLARSLSTLVSLLGRSNGDSDNYKRRRIRFRTTCLLDSLRSKEAGVRWSCEIGWYFAIDWCVESCLVLDTEKMKFYRIGNRRNADRAFAFFLSGVRLSFDNHGKLQLFVLDTREARVDKF